MGKSGPATNDEEYREQALFLGGGTEILPLGGPNTGFQGWGAPRTYALEVRYSMQSKQKKERGFRAPFFQERMMGNTEIVLDFIDAWNTMDWDKAAGLLDDNVVWHNIPMEKINATQLGRFHCMGICQRV